MKIAKFLKNAHEKFRFLIPSCLVQSFVGFFVQSKEGFKQDSRSASTKNLNILCEQTLILKLDDYFNDFKM